MPYNSKYSDLIYLIEIITKLKKVKRSGWVKAGVKNPESVAEHTFITAILALIFADPSKFSVEKLVKMALIHDIAESVVGDLITEGRRKDTTREEKYTCEEIAIRRISLLTESINEWYELWREYESQSSLESQYLRELDKFEMMIQSVLYKEELGDKRFEEFWENGKRYLKDSKLIELSEAILRSQTLETSPL